MPDEFRTMAACEALGTMLPVFERYGSLVTLVMKELLRSVYEVLPNLLKLEGNEHACLEKLYLVGVKRSSESGPAARRDHRRWCLPQCTVDAL